LKTKTLYSTSFLLGSLVCLFLLSVNCVKLENFTVFQDKRRVGGSPQERIKGRKCGEERHSQLHTACRISASG